MSGHAGPDERDDLAYFRVLARARQLLPAARARLDAGSLVFPDAIAEAARACGLTPTWMKYDPDDDSHLARWIGAVAGEVHVVGFSWRSPVVQVLRTAADARDGAHVELDVSSDVTVIGVDAPSIGLVHHEGVCTWIACPPPTDAPEDPRALARQLARELLRDRDTALERVPPPLREQLREILVDRRHIAASKLVREELGWSLQSAMTFVRAADPWWPPGLGLVDAAA